MKLIASLNTLLLFSSLALPVVAQPSNCVNYWVNPRTGRTECLDPGSNPSPSIPSGSPQSPPQPARTQPTVSPSSPASGQPTASQGTMTAGLDQLKACKSGVTSMPNPILAGNVRVAIKGWQNNRCLVEYTMKLDAKTPEWLYGRCRYQRQTIAMMTDRKAYDQARQYDKTGKMNVDFSTSNSRDSALSNALTRDCQFFKPPDSLLSK